MPSYAARGGPPEPRPSVSYASGGASSFSGGYGPGAAAAYHGGGGSRGAVPSGGGGGGGGIAFRGRRDDGGGYMDAGGYGAAPSFRTRTSVTVAQPPGGRSSFVLG